MVRISGIDLQDNKRIDYALTRIYGLGWSNVKKILKSAKIEESRRVNSLNEEELNRLQVNAETYKTEGDLRREVLGNIKRLKEIGSYRGTRHAKNLPARGQRTRSNARTKRGKRVTIGAIKKEMAAQKATTITTDKSKKE